jgi:hypothetical protein
MQYGHKIVCRRHPNYIYYNAPSRQRNCRRQQAHKHACTWRAGQLAWVRLPDKILALYKQLYSTIFVRLFPCHGGKFYDKEKFGWVKVGGMNRQSQSLFIWPSLRCRRRGSHRASNAGWKKQKAGCCCCVGYRCINISRPTYVAAWWQHLEAERAAAAANNIWNIASARKAFLMWQRVILQMASEGIKSKAKKSFLKVTNCCVYPADFIHS